MTDYYWCLTHRSVERGSACQAAERLGPYDSPEEARAWRDRVERREEAWEDEDERWDGDDADDAG
jgi:hypothetical protein